jgi:pleiotropic regulator 1
MSKESKRKSGAVAENNSSETNADAAPLTKRYKSELLAAKSMFLANYGAPLTMDPQSSSLKLAIKVEDEYGSVRNLPTAPAGPVKGAVASGEAKLKATIEDASDEEMKAADGPSTRPTIEKLIENLPEKPDDGKATALVAYAGATDKTKSLVPFDQERKQLKPDWHAPWKLHRVIAGHLGWIHAIAIDPTNEWFATGSADRTIKIWDLASGTLKLTLTGHVNTVHALAVSHKSPYLFSGGTDKLVKCWDLETNKVIRSYHGHLSAVYSMALHPTIDLLVTGGRDSTARVWDIRTKSQVRCLSGHTATVGDIICQSTDPQVVSGSHDNTIRLWDLTTGKAMSTLTHHKKSIRALAAHPKEYTFASGAADNVKCFKFPDGQFLRNFSGHNAIINSLAINNDGIMASGGDNGSIYMWDWKTGHNFQQIQTIAQPGSLDSENGIYCTRFDLTGSRLLTGEADKTIKVWKEDDSATPETHPLNWKPSKKRKRY